MLVGSFLNVVIHRLPVMLDRQWRAQAQETLASDAAPAHGEAMLTAGDETAQVQEAFSLDYAPVTEDRADSDTAGEQRYNLVVPRSACPHCGARIKAHQNIPVLSYLLLGGKCAICGARISPRYPVVELATALLSAAVVWRYGWAWQSIAAMAFTWALVALTVIDLDHQILPDVITLPLMWLGLLASLAWHPGPALAIPVDPWSAIIGAAAGYLSLWLLYWAFRLLTGKEGMGYGDFKLFAAFGAWMGWQMLPLIILLSAFTGAVVGLVLVALRGRDRNLPIPFGPYLAAAGWIALMWGPQLVGGYLHLSGLDY